MLKRKEISTRGTETQNEHEITLHLRNETKLNHLCKRTTSQSPTSLQSHPPLRSPHSPPAPNRPRLWKTSLLPILLNLLLHPPTTFVAPLRSQRPRTRRFPEREGWWIRVEVEVEFEVGMEEGSSVGRGRREERRWEKTRRRKKKKRWKCEGV